MYRLILALALTGCFSLAGCGSDGKAGDGKDAQKEPAASPTEPGDGLNIKVPGVDISVGGGKGVDVKAPGVDVNVDKESGVKVKAPGVDVESKPSNPGTLNPEP